MESRRLYMFLVAASAMLIFFSGSAAAAEQCELIRIDKGTGGITDVEISPEAVTVPVGTCTVWVNFVRDQDVRVIFREDGKQCKDATSGASGFEDMELDSTGESCYMSQSLLLGKSSSLVWNKPGEYKYTIESISKLGPDPFSKPLGPVLAKGTVIVK